MFGAQWSRPPYETSDGTIPWKLFWQLYTIRSHTRTQEMLEIAHAVAHGFSTANPGPKGGRQRVRAAARRWKKLAFPEMQRDEWVISEDEE